MNSLHGKTYLENVTICYSIPVPYSMDGTVIEVYGSDVQGWYEWRVVTTDGTIKRDTGTEGHTAFEGLQYGCPEIALRDALIAMSE